MGLDGSYAIISERSARLYLNGCHDLKYGVCSLSFYRCCSWLVLIASYELFVS